MPHFVCNPGSRDGAQLHHEILGNQCLIKLNNQEFHTFWTSAENNFTYSSAVDIEIGCCDRWY